VTVRGPNRGGERSIPADRRLGRHPNSFGSTGPSRYEAGTVVQWGTSERIVTETETEAEEKR